MATQRPAFAKREREMKLKDKARAKAERREARRSAPRSQKGPPIEGDDTTGEATSSDEALSNGEAGAVAAPAGSTTPGSPASK